MEPSRDLGELTQDLYNSTLLYQNAQLNRQQLLIQWQQLNLLREARGLPALPQPPMYANPYRDLATILWWVIKWAAIGFILICVICMVGSVITS